MSITSCCKYTLRRDICAKCLILSILFSVFPIHKHHPSRYDCLLFVFFLAIRFLYESLHCNCFFFRFAYLSIYRFYSCFCSISFLSVLPILLVFSQSCVLVQKMPISSVRSLPVFGASANTEPIVVSGGEFFALNAPLATGLAGSVAKVQPVGLNYCHYKEE